MSKGRNFDGFWVKVDPSFVARINRAFFLKKKFFSGEDIVESLRKRSCYSTVARVL